MAAFVASCDRRTILEEAIVPVLELQRLDVQAAALRLRLEELPARAALVASEAEQARIETERRLITQRREELEGEERALGERVAELVAGMSEAETRLYSGSVRATKDLVGLQHELDGMKARRRQLEGEEYELLERSEAIACELAELDGRAAALHQEAGAIRAEIAAATAETEVELERIAALRAAVVPTVAGDLLAAYEKLRTEPRLRGVVTALFDGQTCRGCNTTLPIVAATKIRQDRAAAVVQCPRCRRLLIC